MDKICINCTRIFCLSRTKYGRFGCLNFKTSWWKVLQKYTQMKYEKAMDLIEAERMED